MYINSIPLLFPLFWQVTLDLVALALYDVVLLCDDSASMAYEENVSPATPKLCLEITKMLGFSVKALKLACHTCVSSFLQAQPARRRGEGICRDDLQHGHTP